MPVDRRTFLSGAAAVTATAVLPVRALAAARTDPALAPFLHGVASGDPLADRVVLWTRVTTTRSSDVPVRWVVARDAALRDVVRSGTAVARLARDRTVKVDVDGLPAGTTLWYAFEALGRRSPVGRTRTAAARGSGTDRLRYAVVTCAKWESGYFNAYARVAEADVDAVLHLGDYLYEGATDATRCPGGCPIRRRRCGRSRSTGGGTRSTRPTPTCSACTSSTRWSRPGTTTSPATTAGSTAQAATTLRPTARGRCARRRRSGRTTSGCRCGCPSRATRPASTAAWRRATSPTSSWSTPAWRDAASSSRAWTATSSSRTRRSRTRPGSCTRPCSAPGSRGRCAARARPGGWCSTRCWSASSGGRPARGRQRRAAGPRVQRRADQGVALAADIWDGYDAERERLLGFLRSTPVHDVVVLTGDIHASLGQRPDRGPVRRAATAGGRRGRHAVAHEQQLRRGSSAYRPARPRWRSRRPSARRTRARSTSSSTVTATSSWTSRRSGCRRSGGSSTRWPSAPLGSASTRSGRCSAAPTGCRPADRRRVPAPTGPPRHLRRRPSTSRRPPTAPARRLPATGGGIAVRAAAALLALAAALARRRARVARRLTGQGTPHDDAARVGAEADDRRGRAGGQRRPMTATDGGWWTADPPVEEGTDYAFVLDGGDPRPDPRSAWQPEGVHGPSRVVDHDAFAWTDAAWRGVPLAGSVLYELHVGTFTPEGTFDAAVARLDHLVDLGVSAVELLPCNAFAGERGLGLRRRRLVRRARAVRRSGRAQALRRRLPRPRARRRHGRRLQPPRAGRELPAGVRALPHRGAHDALGPGGQPRPARAPTRSAATSSTTR